MELYTRVDEAMGGRAREGIESGWLGISKGIEHKSLILAQDERWRRA